MTTPRAAFDHDADTATAHLDDSELVEAGDPAGMLRQVASSGDQLRSAVRICAELDLAAVTAGGRPRTVVVAGMGGSGIAGDVLAAVCGPTSPVQVATCRGAGLPGWVGPDDLVVAVSCSGATQETLSAAYQAAHRGSRLVCVGGAGSPLAAFAARVHAPFLPVTSAGTPRSSVWALAVPLLVVAERLGLTHVGPEGYAAAAATLDDGASRYRPDRDRVVNPAKSLAAALYGGVPLIWGTSALSAVAARRFGCQLNENAKCPAVVGALPEAAHNQVVTFDGPFAATGLRFVLLTDDRAEPDLVRRQRAAVEFAASRAIAVHELPLSGDGPLQRLAGAVALIDFTTVYLALALGVDPTPVAAITELKRGTAS